jgi:hypothetical protein
MRLHTISVAVLVLATIVGVRPASAACTDASFKGAYGYLHGRQGGLPFDTTVVVGQFTADGKGALSGGSWTLIQNGGTNGTGTFTGKYTIAKNCTGTLTFSTEDNGNTPAHFNIVLDNGNQGFQMIQSDSQDTQPGYGVAQGTVTCGLPGKKQTLAANIVGLDPSGFPEVIVGQLILDGKGNISGTATISNNGTISKGPVTGTYTQQTSCLGTAQITPKGFTAMNFNTVDVNGGKELLLIETDTSTFRSGTAQQ